MVKAHSSGADSVPAAEAAGCGEVEVEADGEGGGSRGGGGEAAGIHRSILSGQSQLPRAARRRCAGTGLEFDIYGLRWKVAKGSWRDCSA